MEYLFKMIYPEASNVIRYDLHTFTCLPSDCRNYHSEFKAIFNNFLVIWNMLALDAYESNIVH